ncbi:MAG: AAA family ATPase, partial [Acetobacteraceae bacterium]
MSDPAPRRRTPRRRAVGASTPPLALQCARNVYQAVDQRMPEAAALAVVLAENAAAFGLPDNAVPENCGWRGPRGRIAAADWRRIGAALMAATRRADTIQDSADRWIGAIGQRLGLDALEARLLALALLYQVEPHSERLYDAISQSRGGPTCFRRDTSLIALLLGAPRAAVAARLAGEAKLLASGVLHLGAEAQLSTLGRLVSLVHREVPPAADIYDQLLGAGTAEPLGWEAFAHLGREAEIAAEVLRAAVAGREAGVNLLLYGPPGTGKTSLAATVAGRVGVRGPVRRRHHRRGGQTGYR